MFNYIIILYFNKKKVTVHQTGEQFFDNSKIYIDVHSTDDY